MNDRFSQLVDTYQDKVYNQAFRMLGNREDAEEAAQDVFLQVYRSLHTFRGESKMSTWIYRITSNVCINRLRRKQLESASLDEPIGEDGHSLGDLIADKSPNPEHELVSKQTAELVRDLVRTLPPNWAMALSLNHFEDLSYAEIAEIMKIPQATVGTYISRGRKKLAESLMARMDQDAVRLCER